MVDPQTDPVQDKAESDALVTVGGAELLLATDKLVKQYRHRRVVNGVSITVAAGEIVGLLGPNGAGKTTTFNMVVGVVKPDGGAVTFLRLDHHPAADAQAGPAGNRIPDAGTLDLSQTHRANRISWPSWRPAG